MNKRYMDFVPARPAKDVAKPKTKKQADSVAVKKESVIEPVSTAKSVRQKVPESAKVLAAEAKSKKVGGRQAKTAEKVDFEDKAGDKKAYQVPRPSFINQNRVTKRPLSKNVYQKKIETPVEEPKGPVTIISKPEKNSKAGLVVTIILTIILGAAAGTVAFLLLPK